MYFIVVYALLSQNEMGTFFLGSNGLTSGESAHWLSVDCPTVNSRESTVEDQKDQSVVR